MSAFIINLIVSVIMAIIFAPKPQNSGNVASGLEDFNFPTADETRPIQVIYGTVKAEGPNVLWYGDYTAEKITKTVKGFLSSDEVDTGSFKYYMGLQFGLGFGKCDLLQVWTDETLVWQQGEIDKETGLPKTIQSGSFTDQINLPDVYAQGDIPDGMVGDFDWIDGSDDQLKNDYLNTQITNDYEDVDEIQPWRNVCQFVWKGGLLGTRTSIRPFKFVMRRIFTPPDLVVQGEDYSTIVDKYDPRFESMNPIYIAYDVMTNKYYGGRYTADDMDIESFKAAAKIIHEEGLGLSLIKDTVVTVRSLLSEISKYADMHIRLNRAINKFEVKLIRDDYNIEEIPVFGNLETGRKNIDKVVSYSTAGVDQRVNEVKITFTVPSEDFIDRIAHFTNEGARFEKDSINAATRDYLFLTDAEKAAQFAERDAIPLTTDLSSLEIDVSFFDSFDVKTGDAFVFNWNPYNVYNKAFRVQSVEFGEVGQKTAKIKAIQDSFGVKNASYIAPPPGIWKPIDQTPQPVNLNIFNAPVFFGSNKIITYAPQPSGSSLGYELLINTVNDSFAGGFTRSGLTTSNYDLDANEIFVTGVLDNLKNFGNDSIKDGNNVCLIKNTDGTQEFIAFETVEKEVGGYTLKNLWRGVLDTYQKPITTGAEIAFFTYGFAINKVQELTAGLNDFQARTYTSKSKLENPPVVQFNVEPRYAKPIVPAYLKVNGTVQGDTIGQVDLELDWNIRNVINQVNIAKAETIQTDTVEDGTTFELVISDEFDNVLKTESLTTNNYTFTDETTINPGGVYYDILKVSLKSLNGGAESFESYELTINRV